MSHTHTFRSASPGAWSTRLLCYAPSNAALPTPFRDLCISLGGDVDTNAAIVGAALGALYGAGAIPARMKGPVLSRGAGSPGQPRPDFLQGNVAEALVRRVWARAAAVGGPPTHPE